MSAIDFFDEEYLGLYDEFFASPKVPPMRDAMADIETLSTRPNAAILSIGVVTFDMRNLTLGERFYTTVSLKSCEDAGLHIDASTVEWWNKQSETARKQAFGGQQMPLADAMNALTEWVEANMVEAKSRCIWGNGASFDPVILESAYRAVGTVAPWPFWGVRCFRTFKNLWANVEPPKRDGTHHNALDDAIHQVEHLFKIRRTLRGKA